MLSLPKENKRPATGCESQEAQRGATRNKKRRVKKAQQRQTQGGKSPGQNERPRRPALVSSYHDGAADENYTRQAGITKKKHAKW